MLARTLFLFFVAIHSSLFSEEIITEAMRNPVTKKFLNSMLKSYWERVALPSERIDDIFDILDQYGDEGELAMLLITEKYGDMTDPSSSFTTHYKQARARKFQSYAHSLLPYIKEGVLLDFGAGDTQLISTLVSLDPKITHAYATDIFPYTPPSPHPKISFLQQQSPDSIPFEKESVDTVIMSTVLHHIIPQVRRSIIDQLYSVLKNNGRIVLVEDSFPTAGTSARNDLESAFLLLNTAQKKDVLCFLDWWGNRLMKNRAEIPLPCTFKTTEEWVALFEDFGFTLVVDDFEGFPPIDTHMVSPKAILVFEKQLPEQKTQTNRMNVQRAVGAQTVSGLVPSKGVSINVSIGGTKILVTAIDATKKILYSSDSYPWRAQLQNRASSKTHRKWIVDKIVEAIKAAESKLAGFQIEEIGISWAGPVSQQGRVIGPNIYGFRFQDLSAAEKRQGGVDLEAMLRKDTPKTWTIRILNDADEEALAEFSSQKISEGTFLILGTGVGAGFIHKETPFYGPKNYKERMGEIGHHVVFNEQKNSYEYYAIETQGEILPKDRQRFTDRLSAPGVARRFLHFAFRELQSDQNKVLSYLNESNTQLSFVEIAKFFENEELSFSLEEKVLVSITEKAQHKDDRALRFIRAIGFEIGKAFYAFSKHYPEAPFLEQIHIGGGLGRLFAQGVENEPFLEGIKHGLNDGVSHGSIIDLGFPREFCAFFK